MTKITTAVIFLTLMNLQVHLKGKRDMHMGRKLWHLCGVLFIFFLYNRLPSFWAYLLIFFALFALVPIDLLRLRMPKLNAQALRIFGPIMRKHEASRVSGASYLFFAIAVLVFFFPHHIVNLSLLFLAFGDPIASYFGIRFGKDVLFKNKTLQGSIAAFFACTIVTFVYCYIHNLMIERLLVVAPICGLLGAASEALPVGELDDNFTFPVLSAILLLGVFLLFSGL